MKGIVALSAAVALTAACGAREAGEGGNQGGKDEPRGKYDEGIVGKADSGDPVEGGTLTWAAFTEPRSLDPAVTLATGNTGGVELANIYDSLTRYDTEKGEVVPQLAESVEPNDDYTKWTITLRKDMKFTDGTPLDAEAVVYSMNRYAQSEKAPEKAIWNANVDNVAAVDATTVEVTLKERWPGFPALISGGPGMIVAKSAGEGESFKPIGAGPFAVENVKVGEELVLKANPDYWDGKPHLDGVRVVYFENPDASYDSLQQGSIDAAMLRDQEKVDELLDNDTKGYLNVSTAGNAGIINAQEGKAGNDPRLRKAMLMAIDPQKVADRAWEGAGIISTELFPESSKWHSDAGKPEYNPEEAKKLVEEAKADGVEAKIVWADGQDPVSRDTVLASKAQLEAVGFTVEPNYLRSAADQIVTATKGDYGVMGWGVAIRDYDPYLKMYSAMHSEGNQLYGMPTSPEMDAAIAEFKKADNEEDQKAAAKKIQEQYNELLPFIIFGPTAEATFWNDNVNGVIGGSASMLLFSKAWKSK